MDASKDLRELSQEAAKATESARGAYSREQDPQLAAALKLKWQELARKSEALRVAAIITEENASGAQSTDSGAVFHGGMGSLDMDLSGRLRFARWATDSEEEDVDNRWLELPDGVFLLGRPSLGSCLYVRDAYRKLAEKVEALQAAGKRHVVVSGNPGLGKTLFAIWTLVRWLRQGKYVVWQTSRNRFHYYRNGIVSQLSEVDAENALGTNRELYYIADGAIPVVDIEVKQSLVAHSPDESRYKEYLKINSAASSPLYMPFWHEEELECVRLKLHPDVTRNQMNQAIARRGEVPRYVLSKGTDDQMDLWIEAAVENLSLEDVIRAVPGSARASHRIAGIHPKDWLAGNFAEYTLTFLSMAVRDLVAMRMNEVVTGGLSNLMVVVNKSANTLAADLGSCIEESIVHALLKQGGKWTLRKCAPRFSRGHVVSEKSAKKQADSSSVSTSILQAASSKSEEKGVANGSVSAPGDETESRDLAEGSERSDQTGITGGSNKSTGSSDPKEIEYLEIPRLAVDYFAYAEELDRLSEHQDVYMQPRITTFPAIDALVVLGSTVYLFQVTRNASHKISAQLCHVLAHLPVHLKVKWVWVLPPHLCAAGRFNAREVPSSDGIGINEEKVQLVEERLQAIEVQYKMSVKELVWKKKVPKAAEDSEVPSKAQFSNEAEDTSKLASGKAGKQQEKLGNASKSTGKVRKQRQRRITDTAALLAQSIADRGIVGRCAQVSLQRPACLPGLLQLRHYQARAAPTLRLAPAIRGVQPCLL